MDIPGMKGSPSPYIVYITYPISKRREDLWPRNPLEFREVLRQYAEEVKLLGEKLLSVISTALDLPPNTLLEKFYYSASGTEELTVGLGWHADPVGITLLQATSSGTQIKIKDEWIIVESHPNAFFVNISDQIEILTNRRFKSVEHRGLAIRDRERIAIPLFFNPAFENVIEPMKSVIDDAHPALYKSMTYGEYFVNISMRLESENKH